MQQLENNMINLDNLINNSNDPNLCPPNNYLAICQLNNDRNYFYISKILCSNINDNSLSYNDYKITGTLDKTSNTISLLSTINPVNAIIFTKYKNFDFNQNASRYAHYSSFLNPFPNSFPNSINAEMSICPEATFPCFDNNIGLTKVNFNQQGIDPNSKLGKILNNNVNACSKIGVNSDNTCKTKKDSVSDLNCVFNGTGIKIGSKTIPSCPDLSSSIKLYNNLNFMFQSPLTNLDYSLCDYQQYFKPSYCNAFILSYITNLGDVKTLNYQFFGSGSSENNLTVQYDKWYDFLNNSPNGLLQKLRNTITSCTNEQLFFTNIDPSSTDKCTQLSTMANNFKNMNLPTSYYKSLYPAVWNINLSDSSTSNSCPITLSTYINYNNVVKYATFNGNEPSLSLFSDGTDQQLFLENFTVLNTVAPLPDGTNLSNVFVLLTTNIRTSNGFYLIPNTSNSGFSNNSFNIGLSDKPDINGKWLIFGFMVTGNFNNRIIDNKIKNNII